MSWMALVGGLLLYLAVIAARTEMDHRTLLINTALAAAVAVILFWWPEPRDR